MRTLLFSQYYPPEVGATQTRVATFARHLAAAGHDVTVVAEVPNHPKGEIFPGWRGRLVDRRTEDGIDTVRLWVATSTVKSFWRRIAFYLSYCLGAAVAGSALALRRRPDVVFASSPPLFVLVSAWVASVIGRAPLVIDIRDVWPAVGQALGELGEGTPLRLAGALERFLYRRATRITAVTQPFVDHIIATGVDPDRVVLLPNGTLPDLFSPERAEPTLRAELGLPDDAFVVGYVGNHGIAQGLGALLDAAEALTDEPRAWFLFVGEGPVKSALEADAAARSLAHVVFRPEVPLERAPAHLAACDLLVVPLRRLDLLDQFVPSKLFDALACERPVALLVDGEARRILDDSGGGWFVPPEDGAALAELVRELLADPARGRAAGRRGRAHVLEHFDRHRQAADLEALLVGVSRAGTRTPTDPSTLQAPVGAGGPTRGNSS